MKQEIAELHEQNHKPITYTLVDFIKIFGEDLEDMLAANLKSLAAEIPPLEKQLKTIAEKKRKILKQALQEKKFPAEEWDVYWSLGFDFDWDVIQLKNKLAVLYVKRDNIKRTWKLYWELQKPESERHMLDIETAKQYPIENIFPGGMQKKGKRLWGCCPFHKEDTPSLMVDEKNTFHCFGCGKYGDVIEFLMELENVSFAEAVRRLV